MKGEKTSLKVLDSICDLCQGKYCTLKEILHISNRFDNRFLVQIKCMEIFKYERSSECKEDIGWEATGILWADEGYAKLFAEYYTNDKTPREIYNSICDRLNGSQTDL